MPCRSFLTQLREVYPQIEEMGASVLAVGTGADYQARDLMAQGVPFPCLIDADKVLYRALDIGHIPIGRFFVPSTWRRYLQGSKGARQGRITGDPLQAPGVVIIDPERRIRYLYRGTTLGDYPPLEEVLATLKSLAGGAA